MLSQHLRLFSLQKQLQLRTTWLRFHYGNSFQPSESHHLLLLLLLLVFEGLDSFVSSDELCEVGHILVRLLQQVSQTFVLLLIDQLPVTLFIFSLEETHTKNVFFLDICSEKQVCHVNIWLYLSREDQVCASHHQPSHSLLLYTLILLLLLSLSVGVVRGYGFGQLLHLCGDRAMIFLKVLCMLKDAVEILLRTKLENRYFCHEQSFVISESGLKCEVCISMI